jgi:hypothetical protein
MAKRQRPARLQLQPVLPWEMKILKEQRKLARHIVPGSSSRDKIRPEGTMETTVFSTVPSRRDSFFMVTGDVVPG